MSWVDPAAGPNLVDPGGASTTRLLLNFPLIQLLNPPLLKVEIACLR
jgi:hypothetical protein